MKVLYTCDDNYAWIMGISLISLFENNCYMEELEIYLLGESISESNKKYINDIAQKYNRTLHLIDTPKLKSIPQNISSYRWPLSAYIRLFAGELLPEYVDKVLYIDCDTIVNGKIDELDKIDISNKIFYGVKDCIGGVYKKNIGLEKNDIYINAGVLLVNLNELRKINIGQRIDCFMKKYRVFINYADQDILNGVFQGCIGCISLHYNVMTIVAEYSYKELYTLRKPTNFYSETEMNAAVDQPIIIHYTTNMRTIRPWYSNTDHPYAALFKQYLTLSPWNGRELCAMKYNGISSRIIGILEKFPRCIAFPILGGIHAFIRPLLSWCKIIR